MTQTRKPSLAEEIAEASSLADIHALLAKGETFQYATRRSERLWQKVAKRRRLELLTPHIKNVHTGHCCVNHGCKYGESKACTVVTGKAKQECKCGTLMVCGAA